jgi:hypothetical protein
MDGAVTAYDVHTLQPVATIADTKGCTCFAIHEKSSILVVPLKRKLALYVWQGSGFVPRREIALTDFPKNITCAANMLIIGQKRHYEAIDLTSFAMSRLIDVEKDYKMVTLELPQSPLRNASLILSIGLQGILMDMATIAAGNAATGSAGSPNPAAATNRSNSDRLEWAGPPVSMHRLSPYLLTLLQDSVEVHSESSLIPLQRIKFPAGSASAVLSLATCILGNPNQGIEHSFVCNGDQLFYLKMVPLPIQVSLLLDYYPPFLVAHVCVTRR